MAAGRGWIGPVLVTLLLSVAGASADPEPPEGPAEATPAPAAKPGGLTLDIVRHVDDLLFKQPDLPRFEEKVDVVGRSDQAALVRAFQGIDLCNGPAEGGAPTAYDMRAMGPNPPSPSFDLTTVAQTLALKLAARSGGDDRYLLYRARLSEGVRYFLHEGRIPASSLYGPSGASFELVQGFSNMGDAARAWRQLDRGLEWKPEDGPLEMPVPVWATTPCRAGKNVNTR